MTSCLPFISESNVMHTYNDYGVGPLMADEDTLMAVGKSIHPIEIWTFYQHFHPVVGFVSKFRFPAGEHVTVDRTRLSTPQSPFLLDFKISRWTPRTHHRTCSRRSIKSTK